jgi:hypothetical protein
MRPNMRAVVEQIFQEGVLTGLNRAFKYNENPTLAELEAAINNELWNAWYSWMIDDEN